MACNCGTIARLRATEEITLNVNDNVLLGDKKQRKADYRAIMSREADISKKEIFAVLFQEMEIARRLKLRDGDARGHKWSPLVIQFSGYCTFDRATDQLAESTPWRGISWHKF